MFIKQTHYGYFMKDDRRIYGLFCGHLPANVTVIEEREVLYPEEGMELVHKLTNERFPAVYLKGVDCEDNYIEMEKYIE